MLSPIVAPSSDDDAAFLGDGIIDRERPDLLIKITGRVYYSDTSEPGLCLEMTEHIIITGYGYRVYA